MVESVGYPVRDILFISIINVSEATRQMWGNSETITEKLIKHQFSNVAEVFGENG